MPITTIFGQGTVLAVGSGATFVPLTGYAPIGDVLNVRVVMEIQAITSANCSLTPAYQFCNSADAPSFTGTNCGTAQTTNTIFFPTAWTTVTPAVSGAGQLIRFGVNVSQSTGSPGQGAWVSIRAQLQTQ